MDCKPWEAKTQSEFVSLAYQWNKLRSGEIEVWEPYFWNPSRGRWKVKGVHERVEVIRWLYKLGRDYQVLDMDFEQFRLVMLDRHGDYRAGKEYTPWWKNYYSSSRYRMRYNPYLYFTPENYRRQRKFKQNGTRYEKKQKDEKKAEWWAKKQFTKDRRRASSRRCGSHCGCKSWKQFTKIKHRRWERDMIRKERYDVFYDKSYKHAEDLWSWD